MPRAQRPQQRHQTVTPTPTHRTLQGAEYSAAYKPQRSKDESKARRKAILSSIGEVSWFHLFVTSCASCLKPHVRAHCCHAHLDAGLLMPSCLFSKPQGLLLACNDQPPRFPAPQHLPSRCFCLPTPPRQDLLLASNDQPFRFPATFTFVVRSFTVLDGIGKSLDPR